MRSRFSFSMENAASNCEGLGWYLRRVLDPLARTYDPAMF